LGDSEKLPAQANRIPIRTKTNTAVLFILIPPSV
jgi:hypothetical protein